MPSESAGILRHGARLSRACAWGMRDGSVTPFGVREVGPASERCGARRFRAHAGLVYQSHCCLKSSRARCESGGLHSRDHTHNRGSSYNRSTPPSQDGNPGATPGGSTRTRAQQGAGRPGRNRSDRNRMRGHRTTGVRRCGMAEIRVRLPVAPFRGRSNQEARDERPQLRAACTAARCESSPGDSSKRFRACCRVGSEAGCKPVAFSG